MIMGERGTGNPYIYMYIVYTYNVYVYTVCLYIYNWVVFDSLPMKCLVAEATRAGRKNITAES